MDILYFLVPLAVAMAAVAVAGFYWAVRDGQFDDTHTPALRILFEEETGEPESMDSGLERSPERDGADQHDQPTTGTHDQSPPVG